MSRKTSEQENSGPSVVSFGSGITDAVADATSAMKMKWRLNKFFMRRCGQVRLVDEGVARN